MSEPPPRRVALARIVWPIVALVALCGVLALTLLSRGRAALEESDAALERGDVTLAIVMAKRAAQAKLPGSPYPERAYAKLLGIARAREQANDREGAAAAYRAVVSAARSTSDTAHVDEARAALAKLDDKPAAAADMALPSPPAWVRYAMAAGVVFVAGGLLAMARGARAGVVAFVVGLVSLAAASLF